MLYPLSKKILWTGTLIFCENLNFCGGGTSHLLVLCTSVEVSALAVKCKSSKHYAWSAIVQTLSGLSLRICLCMPLDNLKASCSAL